MMTTMMGIVHDILEYLIVLDFVLHAYSGHCLAEFFLHYVNR